MADGASSRGGYGVAKSEIDGKVFFAESTVRDEPGGYGVPASGRKISYKVDPNDHLQLEPRPYHDLCPPPAKIRWERAHTALGTSIWHQHRTHPALPYSPLIV